MGKRPIHPNPRAQIRSLTQVINQQTVGLLEGDCKRQALYSPPYSATAVVLKHQN